MVFLRFSYGFPMVFLCFSFGFPMVFLLFPDGILMVSYRFPMIFLWFSRCFPVVFLWLGFLWFSDGDRSYRGPVLQATRSYRDECVPIENVVFSLVFSTLLKKVANRVDETQVFRYEKSRKPRRRDATFYKML